MTSVMKEGEGEGEAEAEEEEEEVAAACPPSATAEADLQRVAAHVDSLIASSYSARLFPGKWQSIRTKLARLSSGLAAAAACSDTGGDSALWELLCRLTATVEETKSLVLCCSGESYVGGKLLLRSNLDLADTKLDLHVRSLAGVYAAGVLTHARAIIVPKPGAGATRDDWRFFVRDLLSRMKVGEAEMGARAVAAFNEVLHGDDKLGMLAVSELPEVAPLLVRFLDSGDVGTQEEAADAISVVAGFVSYRQELLLAGVVAPVVRILERGTALAKERAVGALRKLTENSDNAWSVAAHGGVAALLELCRGESGGGELVASACWVLRNLAGVGEVRRYMVERAAVPVFLDLSRSKEEALQILAMELLQVLAGDGDDDAKARIVKGGGAETLVRVLDPVSSSSSSKARETALMAIQVLCFSPPSSVSALIAAGFLDRLLLLLRHGNAPLQGAALRAVSRLAVASDEARRAMGDAAFMPELVRLLEAKSLEVKEAAAAALARMVAEQRNRRRFVQEENGVSRILRLLGPEAERAAATRSLLVALAAIADSGSGRKKIAACHYVEHLQRLAEADIADAKSIVKKLSCNKFMSILSGIWGS